MRLFNLFVALVLTLTVVTAQLDYHNPYLPKLTGEEETTTVIAGGGGGSGGDTTGFLARNGSRTLTGNWDMGQGINVSLNDGQIKASGIPSSTDANGSMVYIVSDWLTRTNSELLWVGYKDSKDVDEPMFRVSTTEGVISDDEFKVYKQPTNASLRGAAMYQQSSCSAGAYRFAVGSGGTAVFYIDCDGDTTLNGNLYLPFAEYHEGDTNTWYQWLSDRWDLIVGGQSMVTVIEGGSDAWLFNNGKNDHNHVVYTQHNTIPTMWIDGAKDNMGIYTSSPDTDYRLDVEGNITVGNTAKAARIRIRDTDRAGWTCITTLNGVVSGAIC